MKNLAAKIIIFVCLIVFPVSSQATGIPVVDVANLTQSILTAIEEIAQTIKQVQEYKTQIEQYERQMQDSLNFDSFLWDEADLTISNMLGNINSIDAMNALVRTTAVYLDSMEDGVTLEEINDTYARDTSINDRQKQTISELITTIDSQQTSIKSDAERLVELQAKAEQGGEVGQMQALQTANMLSSHISSQLLQIRSVMQAQLNTDAALRLKVNDQDSRSDAAKKAIREGVFIQSTNQVF